MKKSLFKIFILLIMFTTVLPSRSAEAPAEKDGHWRKEMREFKLKFLAQEMELRQDQQKQFFLLYSQMSDEKDATMKSTAQTIRRVTRLGSAATDADFNAATEALMKAHEQELAIDKKYDEKFRAFLSPKQMFKMKEAERKFRDKLNNMRHNNKQAPASKHKHSKN